LRGVVGRKLKAKRWSDEQEPYKRRTCRIRRPISLKSETCPEGMYVDAADISVKAGAHYPGRPQAMPRVLLSLRSDGKWAEESAEAIVVRPTTGEGPNRMLKMETLAVRMTEDTGNGAERHGSDTEGSGRNLRGYV
jgi:hypothetical protein